MLQRLESVRRSTPPPFRHPYWESPRARDERLFRHEIRAYLAQAENERRRLANARVLESVQ